MAISQEEEHELVLRAQAGDRAAQERLVEAYKPEIRNLARRHGCRGLEENDQVHNGVEAFITTLRRFDPELGFRLWTYAQYAVRGAMIGASRQQAGLSDRARRFYRQIVAAYQQLEQTQLDEPTIEQVAARCNAPARVVEEVFAHRQGRIARLPGEEEDGEEGEGHRVPPSLQQPSPEDKIIGKDEMAERYMAVTRCLGTKNAAKFLMLTILREGTFESQMRRYEWPEIAALLADPGSGPNPPWEKVVADFPHLPVVPSKWPEVCALFRTPPPRLTGDALKQWYSRMARMLRGFS